MDLRDGVQKLTETCLKRGEVGKEPDEISRDIAMIKIFPFCGIAANDIGENSGGYLGW
jgi:hypothetical protein